MQHTGPTVPHSELNKISGSIMLTVINSRAVLYADTPPQNLFFLQWCKNCINRKRSFTAVFCIFASFPPVLAIFLKTCTNAWHAVRLWTASDNLKTPTRHDVRLYHTVVDYEKYFDKSNWKLFLLPVHFTFHRLSSHPQFSLKSKRSEMQHFHFHFHDVLWPSSPLFRTISYFKWTNVQTPLFHFFSTFCDGYEQMYRKPSRQKVIYLSCTCLPLKLLLLHRVTTHLVEVEPCPVRTGLFLPWVSPFRPRTGSLILWVVFFWHSTTEKDCRLHSGLKKVPKPPLNFWLKRSCNLRLFPENAPNKTLELNQGWCWRAVLLCSVLTLRKVV